MHLVFYLTGVAPEDLPAVFLAGLSAFSLADRNGVDFNF